MAGDYSNLDGLHFDILREIGNIGAGNATTSLSKILDKKVDMGVPNVNLLEFKDVANVIGGAENLVFGILVKLHGDIDGIMMFLLEQHSACNLVNLLMGRDLKDISEFSEMDHSAIEEIGNILASSYLNSLAALTGLTIKPSIPFMSIDMAAAILSVPAIEFGKVGDEVLFIESVFGKGSDSVSGYFILVPEIESFTKILKSLGAI